MEPQHKFLSGRYLYCSGQANQWTEQTTQTGH